MFRKINENYLCILVHTCTCILVVLRRKQPMISDAFMQFDESASDDTIKYGVLIAQVFFFKQNCLRIKMESLRIELEFVLSRSSSDGKK